MDKLTSKIVFCISLAYSPVRINWVWSKSRSFIQHSIVFKTHGLTRCVHYPLVNIHDAFFFILNMRDIKYG